MAKPAVIKTEDQPLNNIPLTQIQAPEGMETTIITYDYDPLYRLTEAVYTGAITATYRYDYNAVGNMSAYTDTVGTQTTAITRTFNAANQLQIAWSDSNASMIYTYDDNGNLTREDTTNGAKRTDYAYNQRNLLSQYSVANTFEIGGVTYTYPGGSAYYVYDGDGNRLKQVTQGGYMGQPPPEITITYTNDIAGLSQVLVASDGATTTHNLFGLDLIHQDDGTTTRTLLADGLGSVRTEMVGDAVKTVTTYEPYGNLLAQTGTSGTTYAFIGEQHDAATGLLYLRARYFNPYIYQFQSSSLSEKSRTGIFCH